MFFPALRLALFVGLALATCPARAQTCLVTEPAIAQRYEGPCVDGKAQGFGTAQGEDVYEGEFVAGRRHGRGRYVWGRKDKGVFEGLWADDARVEGTQTWLFGTSYTGAFKGDALHGRGKLTLGEGSPSSIRVMEGEFVGGLLNGHGRMAMRDGRIDEGQFRNGLLHGKGRYIRANGETYEGDFKFGKAEGRGVWVRGAKSPCPSALRCQLRKEGLWANNELIEGAVAYTDGVEKIGRHSGNEPRAAEEAATGGGGLRRLPPRDKDLLANTRAAERPPARLVGSQSRGDGGLWGAIAIDPRVTTRYGLSFDFETSEEADARAMNHCGATCSIVLQFNAGCAAIAIDQTPGASNYGYTSNKLTETAARNVAMNVCLASGGLRCVAKAWACSGGRRSISPEDPPAPAKTSSR